MNEKSTQEQRLDTLVEAFKADSVQYKDLQMPADTEGILAQFNSKMVTAMW